jgi:hypothetical protein
MENTEAEIPQDKWKAAVDAEIILLQQCQINNNLKSCMKCPKLLDCETREKYIKVVYESMNKGSGGGFEF